MPSARVICATFPETLQYVPKGKGVHTGTPIRKELFEGEREKGLSACGFSGEKPVLLMMGGSLGAVKLNDCLREILPELTKTLISSIFAARVIWMKPCKAEQTISSLNMFPMG